MELFRVYDYAERYLTNEIDGLIQRMLFVKEKKNKEVLRKKINQLEEELETLRHQKAFVSTT